MNESIPLSQKLYLLGINPQKGGILSSSYTAMDYVLVGSLLLELYQHKKITFEDKRIVVLDRKSDIALHRFILEKLGASGKSLKISRWINKLHFSMKHIRKEIQKNMTESRMIKMKDKSFLFFKWKTPVIINKQLLFHVLKEVDDKIFGTSLSEDDVIFLSFIKPAGLLKRLFPEKDKRKRAKQQLNKMVLDNQVSVAVADAISAAQAVAASVAATSAATTATT